MSVKSFTKEKKKRRKTCPRVAHTIAMHYTRPMTNCCWNMKNYPAEGHNDDCLTAYGPKYRRATMAVTFMDGQTIIYKNVQVCINRLLPSGGEDDGIIIDGTTIRFETSDDTCFTVLGVRQYVYTLDGDQ